MVSRCHSSFEAEMDAAAERVREFQTVPGIRQLSCLVDCHIHLNHFDLFLGLLIFVDRLKTPEVLS